MTPVVNSVLLVTLTLTSLWMPSSGDQPSDHDTAVGALELCHYDKHINYDAHNLNLTCSACEDNGHHKWSQLSDACRQFHEFYGRSCDGPGETSQNNGTTSRLMGDHQELDEEFAATLQYAVLALWRHLQDLQTNTSRLQADIAGYQQQTSFNLDMLTKGHNQTNKQLQAVIHNVTRLQINRTDTVNHIVNDIEHVHTLHENFIKQDGSEGKSNKVDIHGNSDNRPEHENMIRQDGSDGKSNKVSLHRDEGHHDKHDDFEHYLEERLDSLNESLHTLGSHVSHLIDAHLGGELQRLHAEENHSLTQTHDNHTEYITRSTCIGQRRHLVLDSCYYIPRSRGNDHLYSWWDARYLCKQVLGPDADLVAIHNQEQMDALTHMLRNHFGGIQEFWLGGNDLDSEGHWVWAGHNRTITSSDYTNWVSHVYRNVLQNCMSMTEAYRWMTEPCYYERVPICQLKLNYQPWNMKRNGLVKELCASQQIWNNNEQINIF